MNSFIETYLNNPAEAIQQAQQTVDQESWFDTIDEDIIYAQIASPEFRLYEQLI